MKNEKTGDYLVWAGAILNVFPAMILARYFSGHHFLADPIWYTLAWYFYSCFIGLPVLSIYLASIIAVMLGFCSREDTIFFSSRSSSSKSSYKRHDFRPGENIRLHVENYRVSHYGERGDYLTVISAELCSQYGSRDVMGQGRGSTQEVAYMAARDDYEQNLEQAQRDARRL